MKLALTTTALVLALGTACARTPPDAAASNRSDDGNGEGEGEEGLGEGEGEGEGEQVVDDGAGAIVDGVSLRWDEASVDAGTHDVGRTFFFQARRTEQAPELFVTVAFREDGEVLACTGEGATSNLEVRLPPGEGFFAAPVFGEPEATCAVSVVELPACPGDRLTVTFSGFLLGVAAAEGGEMIVEGGSFSAPTEWVLHGEPPPAGCD